MHANRAWIPLPVSPLYPSYDYDYLLSVPSFAAVGQRDSCPPPTASASASTSASTSSSSVLVRLGRIQQHLHVPHTQLPPRIRGQWCVCGSRSAQLSGHTLPAPAPAGLCSRARRPPHWGHSPVFITSTHGNPNGLAENQDGEHGSVRYGITEG
ncbi:hypothetical protein C8R44DRAFT_866674 [Mycena epipterygia]|nr:hypothetical protein C8R44DRAFT_866674 [Mycena epipterygia]